MDSIQKQMQAELEKLQNIQSEMQKYVSAHQKLNGQLTENENVKDELGLLDDTNIVYKLIGPVLVKQELAESKSNIDKRIDYIKGEIKRQDQLIKDLESKQTTQSENLQKLQKQYQQTVAKVAAKA